MLTVIQKTLLVQVHTIVRTLTHSWFPSKGNHARTKQAEYLGL